MQHNIPQKYGFRYIIVSRSTLPQVENVTIINKIRFLFSNSNNNNNNNNTPNGTLGVQGEKKKYRSEMLRLN
jgi:hypothetical protein